MAEAHHSLIDAIRGGLAAAADPTKAPQMQAYMKSAMPFYGVQTPTLRLLCKAVFAAYPLPDRQTWLATVAALWRHASHREERYAAINLSGAPRYRAYQDADLVSGLYEEIIVTGAWWDFVDEVAIRRVGPILRQTPGTVVPMMYEWAGADNLWKRRTAIICQIGSKGETDLDLLTFVIDRNAADPGFFLRKSIGWALRAYAKDEPEWVRTFVASREATLSGLSKREALKNLTPAPSASPSSPGTPPR